MGGCFSRIQEFQDFKSRQTNRQTIFHIPLNHNCASTSTQQSKNQTNENKSSPKNYRNERLI